MRSNLKPSFFQRLKLRLKRALGINPILCDSCRWDWRSACHNPQRPNAAWCPDYSRRGR